MNKKVYKALEYNKILALLESEAGAEMTRKVIRDMEPLTEFHEIERAQDETAEAVDVLIKGGGLPGGFYDIGDCLNMASKGGTLDMKGLLQVLFNMRVAERTVSFLKKEAVNTQIISDLGSLLYQEKTLADDIDRCIISEDEMSDNASQKLKSLRRSIQRQNENIRSKLSGIIGSIDNQSMLQDSIVTLRQGRYVIPVKQEHRGKLKGIVHDQSQSGATLFIEPQIIVEMNNELRELEVAEQAEIARILAELSASVGGIAEMLLNNQEILLKLDFIFAKGKLAVKQNAIKPVLNLDGIFNIKKGRHPLIDKEKVVPIDISFGRDFSSLIVTGPNTGGKTVTLKTVGIFVIMAQAGLHIPCNEGSELPIMDEVFADIGDEQSIEQSLSTFSSHMKNIVRILENAGNKTLVLLDELGAGTDPQEGAALAIAILEDLKSKGAKVLATTHYTELKKYALSKSDIQNASMEFDLDTLSPTYRLITGIPGKSNAFAISEKLGLSKKVIGEANRLLDRKEIEFEEVISAIENERRLAEQERDEAIMLNLSMKKKSKMLEEQIDALEAKKEKILQRAREEANKMVREAKELTTEMKDKLKELAEIDDEKERNRTFEASRKKVKDAAGRYKEKIRVENKNEPISVDQLKVGHSVRVLSLNQAGTILSLPDEKGDLTVQAGSLKISLNIKDIAKMQEDAPGIVNKTKKQKSYGSLYSNKTKSVGLSVSVIGKNLDEALMEVEKYLDDAYMAGLKEVTIIHGRGKGILREGIADMLRRNKHVDEFNTAGFHNGGNGATEVKLK